MNDLKYDVLGVGNAIVDVVANVDDEFISDSRLAKGTMTLIEADVAETLYSRLPNAIESSGGSAANSIAYVANLEGKGAYFGKIRDDELGDSFREDIRNIGVNFDTPSATTGPATARCMVLVTPDADRTMQTYLGACVGLGPDDIDEGVVGESAITYLEGYLWDPPEAKRAFVKACELAHAAGRRVALTLSDPFCVDRHRAGFLELINDHVDIVLANEEEVKSLFQTESFGDASNRIQELCEIAALTRSERGSVIVSGATREVVPADRVERVLDTTGAGDAYAGGFLFGVTNGYDLREAATIGGIAAAEVIQHFGARPEIGLAEKIRSRFGPR